MGDVVALVLGRDRQARLREQLRRRATVRYVARCGEVVPAVGAGRVAAVIVELADADGLPTAPTIRQLRAAFPYVPVLALCPLAPPAGHELLAVARAGAAGLILRDVEDAGAALYAALDRAADEVTAREALDVLGAALPAAARPVVEYCLTQARRRLTVADVASTFGVHRKTLGARLRRDDLPAPEAVIGWGRLLLAARLLEGGGRALEHVALELEFSSGAALRNMFSRYTALRPRDLRGPGGFRRVALAFRDALGARCPGATPNRPEVGAV